MSSVLQAKTASGIITTQNLNPTTTATAGSAVLVRVAGYSTLSFQTVGTYTGALSVQVTIGDTSVGWVTLTSANAITNAITGAQSATVPSAAQQVYQVDVSAFTAVRITPLSAFTGSVAVGYSVTEEAAVVGIDTPVVVGAGSASIGTVTANQGTFQTGTAYNLVTAATTNGANIKSTAGNVFEITVSNPTATAAYVKFYNKATAPTVGTDTPILTIPVPATAAGVGTVTINLGAIGKRFSSGIGIAVTGAVTATDTTATVAGIQVNATYI